MKYELIGETKFYLVTSYNEVTKESRNIIEMKFTDEVAPKGVELTDISNDRDGSVVGWMEDNGVYKVSTQIEGQRVIFNMNSSFMFSWYTNLKLIDFSMVDTSQVVDMHGMFDGCKNLQELDLSNFDTSQVVDMNRMFSRCNFTHLELLSFDTSYVRDMSKMFSHCTHMKVVDLSSFDTNKVEDMSDMFYECSSLTSLNLTHFKTQNVRKTDGMFARCSKITSLDLSDFDMSALVSAAYMFQGCTKMKRLCVSNLMPFAIDSTKMGNCQIINPLHIFKDCNQLEELIIISHDKRTHYGYSLAQQRDESEQFAKKFGYVV